MAASERDETEVIDDLDDWCDIYDAARREARSYAQLHEAIAGYWRLMLLEAESWCTPPFMLIDRSDEEREKDERRVHRLRRDIESIATGDPALLIRLARWHPVAAAEMALRRSRERTAEAVALGRRHPLDETADEDHHERTKRRPERCIRPPGMERVTASPRRSTAPPCRLTAGRRRAAAHT